ncbi:MAG TPA: PaaI family thioesterase [candidate division Zixibacteria bacterium]|nr:PaaI family thioesterase [candidate division Zixibacteria bacterium]
MDGTAFQDQGSVRHCYGCGADNPKGLHVKSYWDGDEAVATWQPQPHHCGGSRDVLYGGIVASLIDCHSLNLAIAAAYRAEGRPIGSAPRIGYVTASMSVSYLRPAPVDRPVELRARIERWEGRKVWVSCTLSAGGTLRATGQVLGVRVTWE